MTSAGNGSFNACYSAGPLAKAYVRFTSASTATWRVITSETGGVYAFTTPTRSASGTVNLGTVWAPTAIQDAWKIVDTMNLLYWKRANPTTPCWTKHQAAGKCDIFTVVWSADRDGGYWDYGGTNFVILGGDQPDSQHLVLHEAGHWFQWQLYNKSFPEVTGCSPHYVERSSSTSCAWTEGFADAVAAYALGDYRYVFDTGQEASFVNDPSTPGWDSGDTVQGRVGSSLLDLWAGDGPDGGSWDSNIAMMSGHFSQDFREYFTTDRPAAGLGTQGVPTQILASHTIRY
ncbi:metalloprotease [Luteipulveratus mongoliensis]|uniref:Metalloprotease n=1 Tax=Luteipulveratus mongoliensis TaxID=571913 RepID=A0A0K1JQG8_9MICO|nr:metalloprotease [Luteipulveratus mongoliensis]